MVWLTKNSGNFKAQGAFEYMVSYGWAILIVLVLGIMLFSLGILNPSQTPTATGFVVLRPISWSFTGGAADSANVSIALSNVAGTNIIIWLNSTDNTTSQYNMHFKKGDSDICRWSSISSITDSAGNNLPIVNGAAAIPVGVIITITGTVNGSNCGGLIASSYRYYIHFVSKDEYLVLRRDSGLITGRYV